MIVRGAGAGSTVLTASGISVSGVLLFGAKGSSSVLEGVTVRLPAENDVTGITQNGGTISGVTIEAPAGATVADGLSLNGGVFTKGRISVASGTGLITSGGGQVTYSAISGSQAAVEGSNDITLRGDVLSGGSPIVVVARNAAPLTLEDSVVLTGAGVGVSVEGLGGSGAKAVLRQDAIVGPGTAGLTVLAESVAADARVSNSIISGPELPLNVFTEKTKPATAETAYTSYDFAHIKVSALSTVQAEHTLTTLTGFVDPLAGDCRLAPGSPLIDEGAPGELEAGELTTDLSGRPRIVHGRRDAGPYEYQWTPLSVTGLAEPGSAAVGQAVAFAGAASAVEPGDAIASSQWSFDDGASVPAGTSATHAFSSAGTHTATLTVTDLKGLTSSATVSVTVSSTACLASPCGSCGATAKCAAGSRVTGLRIRPSAFRAAARGATVAAKGGAKVSYEVRGQVSRVDFTIVRLSPGVTKGSSCVRRVGRTHGRPCTRAVRVAAFTRISPAGGNGFRLTGRVAGHKLAPGRYRLSGMPASGTAADGASAAFQILR